MGKVEDKLNENYPDWKERRKEQCEDFYNSDSWWSWCITPLSHRDMLLAVAWGDAEVKEIKEEEWPVDLFFRWIKKVEDRSHKYFEKPLEGCGCDGEWPEPREN